MHIGDENRLARNVLKIAYHRVGAAALETEAENYLRVRHLQGQVVPRFHGLFQVHGLTTCIVLDYCGESMRTGFYWAVP
jgi:hypothetical protein